jgi:hypothetical protein
MGPELLVVLIRDVSAIHKAPCRAPQRLASIRPACAG